MKTKHKRSSPNPPGVNTTVRISAQMDEDLRALAVANHRSFSAEVRRAIALHIESEKGAAA